ncbi:MFS transporter [Streptomyces sp. MP131-18]|uniref:MFS transporter n=1 Tax=Streptomyces sp. MP131-18 TaxID=1857892 RepID=UPI00097C0148|nr:MFS transporter [Streptomyces sp. MP131-18]ONK11974.1 Inner membrane transport protein YdhP [Streptomyces sp. MP131-18]
MPLALLALAIGAFGIGTTEFVVTGLLPEISDEYGVSVPTAGFTTSGYALGVVVGAPVLAIAGARVTRKRMLLVTMVLFIAGNLVSAVAPAFGVMLAGRVVASLAHGAFFGIGSVVAASLVAPEKRAGAIAWMFTGLTVANVVGVPAGTLLGQQVSWRLTFGAITLIGVVALVGVAALVPRGAGDAPAGERSAAGGGLRRELAAFRDSQVLLAMAMTVLGFGGVFAAITYIAPMMTDAAGYAESSVTWLLMLFGVGLVAGNLIGGRYADRALMPMLYTSLAALAVALAAFTVTANNKVAAAVTLMLIGAFGFATVPPLQKRVLDHAPGAATLASAVNIGAFNLGNALAAWLGGLALSAGAGATLPNLVGAAMAVSALALAVVAARLERGGRRPAAVAAGAAAGPVVAAEEAEAVDVLCGGVTRPSGGV